MDTIFGVIKKTNKSNETLKRNCIRKKKRKRL